MIIKADDCLYPLGIFFVLCLLAGYAGLSSLQLGPIINDKVLHTITFFILTVVFYWVIDTTRRRTLNLTIVVCTVTLGVGSEFLQALLPNNDRNFDLYDIVANLVGSLTGLAICSWYHQRMLDRKRQRRYSAVLGNEPSDIELGEGLAGQEEGLLAVAIDHERPTTLEQEVDNWDENAVDNWEDDDEPEGDIGVSGKAQATEQNGGEGANAIDKKRVD
jgi:VanZ family protein